MDQVSNHRLILEEDRVEEEVVVDFLCRHRRHRLVPSRGLKGEQSSFFFDYMNL